MTKPLRFCRRCGRTDFNCECLTTLSAAGAVAVMFVGLGVLFLWWTMIVGMLGGL